MKYDHYGSRAPFRVVSDLPNLPMAGPGWTRVPINEASHGADVLLLSSVTDETRRLMDLGLPMVIVVNDSTPLCLLDRADGHVLSTDTPAFVSSEIEGVIQSDASGVREWSESPPDISALSLEAGRIATALARMAATAPAPKSTALVDATLVRKVIRLRRDRERFFPAEIFADPAWDMLLDLLAAHMENRQVAVSSLCIAACVPTTTALRWIRSLSEAGVFERTIDPTDARRTYISLSASSVEGMMAWLRRFAEVFAPRG